MTSDNMVNPVLEEYMKSPLVVWVRTFEDEDTKPMSYDQLRDGVLLYSVWLQIDPHPPYRGITQPAEDGCIRLRNFDILLHNIKAFYEEVLGQLLVTRIPDVLVLVQGTDEASINEMQALLLLILSSAVQCERKQYFIEHIKMLDVTVQHTIMECIQTVADNPEAVWSAEWSELRMLPADEHEHMYTLCVQHLRNISKERDELAEKLVNLVVDQEGGVRDSLPGPEKPHLIVELADYKSRVRKLQQELEEKNESLTEVKEELDETRETINHLRQENLELIQEARTSVAYRDEIDILTERVRKMDRLENEIQKYKEKLNELDFFKSRVEELREDNRILVETKLMLEEQLEGNGKKSDQILDLEAEIRKCNNRLKGMSSQREVDQRKIQQLLEENTQMQIDRKTAMEELVKLQAELCQTKDENAPSQENSLMLQLNTDAQTRALQLELENRRLRMLVEDANKESTEQEEVLKPHILNMEAHKKELEKLVEEMRQNMKIDQAHCEQMEKTVNALTTENQKLQRVVETNQMKLEEIQEELQGLESENRKLNKTLDTLKLSIPKLHVLEREVMELNSTKQNLEQEKKSLEKENGKLKQILEVRESTIDEYISKLSLLEQQNEQLQKESENTGQLSVQLQEAERENRELLQQISVDKKMLSSLRQELVNEKFKCQQLQAELQRIDLALKTEKEHSPPPIKPEEQIRSYAEPKKIEHKEIDLSVDDVTDATGHILRLKSIIAELDHRESALEEHNRNLSSQNAALKEQSSNSEVQIETLERNIQALTKQNSELQASRAKLEVELSLLNSSHNSISSQNSMLKTQLVNVELEYSQLKQSQQELQGANNSLIDDQKVLQALHEQLASDYDCLVSNYTSVKAVYKTLRNDHISLKEQAKTVKDAYEQLIADHQTLQEAQKTLQIENNELKCKCTELQNEVANQELETSKLTTVCETLTERNSGLEEEQKAVLAHVSFLLVQYHELLSQVLKQQGWFHREDTYLKTKLRELWQQKEKLEKMIKEHCTRIDTDRKKQTKRSSKRHDDDSESNSGCRPSRRKGNNRSSLEDLSQDDHIPVRDVGPSTISPPKQTSPDEIPQSNHTQTTVENYMTINLTTNLNKRSPLPTTESPPRPHLPSPRATPNRHRSSLVFDPDGVEVVKSPADPPPQPASTPPASEGKKENSIWYEYGCV